MLLRDSSYRRMKDESMLPMKYYPRKRIKSVKNVES